MTSNVAVAVEALQAAGIRYRLGAKWNGRAPWPPKALDCSGLVTAVGQRLDLGIGRVHGSANQWAYCARYGRRVTAAEAATTPGLLCFRVGVTAINHVAITLGENKTMEARSSHTTPQVGVFGAMTQRRWTAFVTVPGLTYAGPAPTPPPEEPVPHPQPTQTEEVDDMYAIQRPDGLVARISGETWCWLTAEEWTAEQAAFRFALGRPFPSTPVNDATFAALTSSRKALR